MLAAYTQDGGSAHAGFSKSQRELFLDTLICNVEPNSTVLMAGIVPTGLAFQSNHHTHSFGSSRHVGYAVHGQHEVKVAHKCDAFDGASDCLPLTQEREPYILSCYQSVGVQNAHCC